MSAIAEPAPIASAAPACFALDKPIKPWIPLALLSAAAPGVARYSISPVSGDQFGCARAG